MYLNANQISQSENKKQSQEEEFQLKKLRENRAERDKTKKETKAKKETNTAEAKDYTINELEVWVGNEFRKMKCGDSIEVPYDETVYVKPQSKHGLTTEFLLKLQQKNTILNDFYHTDDKGYITDKLGKRVIIRDERFDLGELGILPEEEITGEDTYENTTEVFKTAQIKIKRGKEPQQPQPVTGAPPQTPAPATVRPQPAPVKGVVELKALAILGGQSYLLTNNDPQKTFGGFMAEGVFYGRNIQAWANYLNLGFDVEDINVGGTVLKRHFSQANMGLDYAIGFLNFEIEAISSNNKYNSDRAHIFITPLQETSYNGVFFSAGARISLSGSEDGFAGGSFITANYGLGFGNKKEHYADGLWHDLTYASESIKEKNYFHIFAKVPFAEVNYSQGEYDNPLKTLKGKRENLSAKVFLPLGKFFKPLDGLFLTGFYSISKVNDTQLKDFENTMFGIGLTFRK
jgi:hypothetical protein